MIRILLVDDQPAIRCGLRMRLGLEPDMHIVAEAGCGADALRLSQMLHPDVVVMDVEMPGLDGIQTAEKLRTLTPGSAVVMLSIHDNTTIQARALEAGAAAFVGKHGSTDAVVAAIRRAAINREGPTQSAF
jgi:DNA-binding NarL/FixJ family response regulator